MKKVIAFFVLLVYMASAIGLTFSFHYCGGHFKKICFTADTEKGCCSKGKHKKNCCEDKVVSAKFKDNHASGAKAAIISKIFFAEAVLFFPQLAQSTVCYNGFRVYTANDPSPPIIPGVPIYLMNRVLRI